MANLKDLFRRAAKAINDYRGRRAIRGLKLNGQADFTLIFIAALDRNEHALKYLLSKGENPDAVDSGNATPLIHAAHRGWSKGIEMLLEAGANPEAKDRSGLTALMVAASNGQIEAVKTLLRAGANPNARDDRGATALIWVARQSFMTFYRRSRYDPPNKEGRRKEIIEALLNVGADPRIQDRGYQTAQMEAMEQKHYVVAQILRDAEKAWEYSPPPPTNQSSFHKPAHPKPTPAKAVRLRVIKND